MSTPEQGAGPPKVAALDDKPMALEFDCWPLEPTYPVRWKEPAPKLIIKKPPPGKDSKQKPKKTWIEIRLVTDSGDPMPNEQFVLHMPGGAQKKDKLNGKGRYRLENIDPGVYEVSFPDVGYTIFVSAE